VGASGDMLPQPHVALHILCAKIWASTPGPAPIEQSPASEISTIPKHTMPACTRSAQFGLMQLVPLQSGRRNGQPPSQEPRVDGRSTSTRYFLAALPCARCRNLAVIEHATVHPACVS
jgi:hypothetical protein